MAELAENIPNVGIISKKTPTQNETHSFPKRFNDMNPIHSVNTPEQIVPGDWLATEIIPIYYMAQAPLVLTIKYTDKIFPGRKIIVKDSVAQYDGGSEVASIEHRGLEGELFETPLSRERQLGTNSDFPNPLLHLPVQMRNFLSQYCLISGDLNERVAEHLASLGYKVGNETKPIFDSHVLEIDNLGNETTFYRTPFDVVEKKAMIRPNGKIAMRLAFPYQIHSEDGKVIGRISKNLTILGKVDPLDQ